MPEQPPDDHPSALPPEDPDTTPFHPDEPNTQSGGSHPEDPDTTPFDLDEANTQTIGSQRWTGSAAVPPSSGKRGRGRRKSKECASEPGACVPQHRVERASDGYTKRLDHTLDLPPEQQGYGVSASTQAGGPLDQWPHRPALPPSPASAEVSPDGELPPPPVDPWADTAPPPPIAPPPLMAPPPPIAPPPLMAPPLAIAPSHQAPTPPAPIAPSHQAPPASPAHAGPAPAQSPYPAPPPATPPRVFPSRFRPRWPHRPRHDVSAPATPAPPTAPSAPTASAPPAVPAGWGGAPNATPLDHRGLPPGWRPPKGYELRRKRRRWPRRLVFLLLTLGCCCGCPAYYLTPIWRQYPASAAIPSQAAGMTLRQDAASTRAVRELKRKATTRGWLAEQAFAAVYDGGPGWQVKIYGTTGFRLTPKSDLQTEISNLTDDFGLTDIRTLDAGSPGGYLQCGVGAIRGDDLVLCAWADHGSLGVATFSAGSIDRSAETARQLREGIVSRG